jgi:hypothetical protein
MIKADRPPDVLAGLLSFFALITAAILQFEIGFPYEGERYLGVLPRFIVYLLSAARLGRWVAPMPLGPTLGVGLVLQTVAWHLLARVGIGAPPAAAIVLLPALLWRPSEVRAARARFDALRHPATALGLLEMAAVLLIAGGLLAQFLSSLALPTGDGSLAGILMEADHALLGHAAPSPLAALLMPALVLDRNGIMVNLTGFSCLLILILSLDAAARRLGLARSTRLFAAAALATSPRFGSWIAETAMAPRLLAFFGVGWALITEIRHGEPSRRLASALGLIAGLLLAVLASSPMIEHSCFAILRLESVLPIAIVLGLGTLARRHPVPAGVILIVGLAAMLGGAPLFTLGLFLPFLAFGIGEIDVRCAGSGRLLLAAALIISLGVMTRQFEGTTGILSLHSGAISPLHHLIGHLRTGGMQARGDALLPREARVLSIGEHRLFHLHRRAEAAGADRLGFSPDETRARLEAWGIEGFTHLLFSPDATVSGLAPETKAALALAVRELDAVSADHRTGMGLYRLPLSEKAAPR